MPEVGRVPLTAREKSVIRSIAVVFLILALVALGALLIFFNWGGPVSSGLHVVGASAAP